MYLFGNANFFIVIKMWLFIVFMGSYIFSAIGLNAAHHHPDIVHDGDTLRDGLDWGIYQLDTVMERADIKGSLEITHCIISFQHWIMLFFHNWRPF